jgi:glutamate--cysteine ligase
MPTQDIRLALDRESARDVIARAVTPAPTSGNGIGLEVEFLPVVTGDPTRRLRLSGDGRSVRRVLADHGATYPGGPGPVGTTVTVEPGGQVELATRCYATPDEVLAEATQAADTLAAWFDHDDVALVAAGVDLWHDLARVPQQLDDPRYPAMAAYFATRDPAGAIMMRHTCALQLSLDLGARTSEAEERWALANLLAPVATATFANSPCSDGTVRSSRSLAWQHVDPTRTGFPADLLRSRGDRPAQATRAALAADVLLIRTRIDATGRVAAATPGRAGWSFNDWIEHGHPVHGWPDADDLRYHLTTLFHEVRDRGHVELRSVDALPHRWRPVPVVLYAGALFDPVARGRILEVLEPHRAALPGLLRRAATTGLADPSLCALAVEACSFALAGARRLPGIDARHVGTAEAFIDRYTVRGRCPADELAEAYRQSPARALALVREPTPTTAGSRR